METPAQLVANLRVNAGLSQRALASRAGCTRSTVVRIENGAMDPTVTMLARITAATGHRLDIRASQPLRRDSLAAIAQLVLSGDEPAIPFTHIRGLIDWLGLNPSIASEAISDPPPRTNNENLDNLLAAVANKIADEGFLPRPSWTSDVPIPVVPWRSPGTPRMQSLEATKAPRQLIERRIFLAATNFWRDDA
jgi:transcriptional regulator with XRE-family HTH domain